MIFDSHVYTFPDLKSDGGYSDKKTFRKHLQLGIASHFQPAWSKKNRTIGDDAALINLSNPWSFDGLKECDFKPTEFGRFEWVDNGESFVKQYLPPSVENMAYSAEHLIAEMDYASVDMALIHRHPYLGISNQFISNCVKKFPSRLKGLAHIEEWLITTQSDLSIQKLESAFGEMDLSGLQFIPDSITLYNKKLDWTDIEYKKFWDKFNEFNKPLFITPNYSLLTAKGDINFLDSLNDQFSLIDIWMKKYPNVKVVFTHGLPWRMFVDGDRLNIPEEVFQSLPRNNLNFSLQLLFPIFLGDIWDYPMIEVKSTVENLVKLLGAERLIWGTDMPMVMRYFTYKQCVKQIQISCDFLKTQESNLITGGNISNLLGIN